MKYFENVMLDPNVAKFVLARIRFGFVIIFFLYNLCKLSESYKLSWNSYLCIARQHGEKRDERGKLC